MTRKIIQIKARLVGTDNEPTDARWYAFDSDAELRGWIEGRMEADESVVIEEMALGCEEKVNA